MSSPSLLHELIEALQCLPGIGRKSAQRMAYHLLDKDRAGAVNLSEILSSAMQNISNCSVCRDYTEKSICNICSNERRDSDVICVVETPSDLIAVESTATYSGKYFVLMGNLSPLDGIGPDELGLDLLKKNIQQQACREIIIATSATVEGEATAHFIKSMAKQISPNIIVSRLAQGVPIGGELGYLDASTLSLSLANRQGL